MLDQFLTMSLFEKRQFYKCGYNFVTLEEIPTWSSSSTEAFQTKKPPSNSNWLKLVNEKVSLYTGNIIALEIDAIVNSANTKLRNRKNGSKDKSNCLIIYFELTFLHSRWIHTHCGREKVP